MRTIACAVLVCCVPGAAFASHGFGTFDMTKEIEITGTVTEHAFVNPHSWLYLDVTGADGEHAAMRCEMRSATTLRRSGWTPEMFPVGGKVTIKGSPDRKDPAACYVSTVVLADGSSIDRYGQRTPPVAVESAPRAARLANGDPNIAGLWAAEQIVGHWENDVLVVDTVGIRAGRLTRGLVHSDALQLTERFSLDPKTQALEREFVAADPLFFREPYRGADVVYPSNVPYQSAACDDRSLR